MDVCIVFYVQFLVKNDLPSVAAIFGIFDFLLIFGYIVVLNVLNTHPQFIWKFSEYLYLSCCSFMLGKDVVDDVVDLDRKIHVFEDEK